MPLPSNDRYTALKRRLEDLEIVHQDDKRAHLAETERLRIELARHQKQHADQSDVIEKQRKQLALLEARLQELKKSGSTEGTQLKDLRAKLRAVEQERSRLQADAANIVELKASLSIIEDKRKREIKQRDAAIQDLETRLSRERKSRELLLNQCDEFKKMADEASRSLQTRINGSQTEIVHLKDNLRRVQEEATSREDELLSQLEQHRLLLSHVASEFGSLASKTVPRSKHDQRCKENNDLRLQNMKLERKLANSETQVVELASLIRCVKAENQLLHQQLRDTTEELTIYQIHVTEQQRDSQESFDDLQEQLAQDALYQVRSEEQTQKLLATFYRHQAENLMVLSSLFHAQLRVSETLEEHHSAQFSEILASHEAIAGRLETVQNEYLKAQENTAAATLEKEHVEKSVCILKTKVAEQQGELDAIESLHQVSLNNEKMHIARLNSTIQKQHMAEDALRDEIERLTNELTSLEPYKGAFEQLTLRVDSLLARKKVAEDEAAELSEFNAQILGHHNLAQRIMYVDRIRRDLAECKQRIAELLTEQEGQRACNASLQEELDMYKSVMVPPAHKPKTHITRVARLPLANMTQSLNWT